MNIDDVIGVHIITVPNMSDDEINDLIKREEVVSLAKEKFTKGEITFQDFLDCLEVAEVNIDEFLGIANSNAHAMGF